ncbi:hypothetical protein RRG08_050418 [Elysia crispata]|uniref:Lysosome-associated membrane glycoprotein 2-like luminal domain-containing protein n=1 Tax=Elysia crispata TaxID=231223 RepID=A0AAE0ZLJ4_9GAST|nr:hypothetical protein RRG08_050418 [Elysia crispata]
MAIHKAVCVTLLLCLMLPLVTSNLFKVRSETGHVCILLDIDFRILLTASRDGERVGDLLVSDARVQATGNCSRSKRSIKLEFLGGEVLKFEFDIQGESVMLSKEFTFNPQSTFANLCPYTPLVIFKDPQVANLGELGTSYKCLAKESSSYSEIRGLESICSYTVDVDVMSVRAQAFFVKHSEFSAPNECKLPVQKNWARILVGGVALCFLLAGVVTSVCLHVVCKRNSCIWVEKIPSLDQRQINSL